jgi:RNA polymerase sigma factor (sigma-70 family)
MCDNKSRSDEDLAKAIIEVGDITERKKFSDEWAKFCSRIEGILKHKLPWLFRHPDKKDLINDGWLKVWRVRNKYDPSKGAKFATWAVRVFTNAVIDKARRRKSKLLRKQRDEIVPNSLVDPSPVAPSDAAEFSDLKAAIDAAMSELSGTTKDVFHLRYYKDLSYDEIAQILQIQPGSVGSFLTRGREIMREFFLHSHPDLVNEFFSQRDKRPPAQPPPFRPPANDKQGLNRPISPPESLVSNESRECP